MKKLEKIKALDIFAGVKEETLEKIIIDYPNSIYVIEARKLLNEL